MLQYFRSCPKLKDVRGFTLPELIIYVAAGTLILIFLALTVGNPSERAKQRRDAIRLSDMLNLYSAITAVLNENPTLQLGTEGVVYDTRGGDLGWLSRIDNNGWIPIDFAKSRAVGSRIFSTLPVDPSYDFRYDAAYFYRYSTKGGKFEIDCLLESEKNWVKASQDQGNNNAVDGTGRYEVGTDLTILP